jgi:hypothetical protein
VSPFPNSSLSCFVHVPGLRAYPHGHLGTHKGKDRVTSTSTCTGPGDEEPCSELNSWASVTSEPRGFHL